MNKFDYQLWQRFIEIAQPYWYPIEQRGGRNFLFLLTLLLVFIFASLFAAVSAISLTWHFLFPKFFDSIAPGLARTLLGIINSPAIAIVGLMLLLPALGFFYFRENIRPRWQQWGFLALLLTLSLGVSGLNVTISYVGNFFQTALAKKDEARFWRFLFVYAGVFVVGTPIVVIYRYIQRKLGLYWREWLTNHFLNRYFKNRAYYEINSDQRVDNPDQRISEDVNSFTRTSLTFLLIILGSIIDLISFTGILWTISKLLTGVLIVYAFFGTIVTVVFGKRLIGLNFNQLRREADFRYGLVHVRDNAESIAFYRGEEQESNQVGRRFIEVIRNFNLLIGWQRNLDFFTTGYGYLVIILPTLVVVPRYFAGEIEFGDIAQAGFAFRQVLDALSLIVTEIERLSAFAAGVNRLGTFEESLEDPTEALRQPGQPMIDTVEAERLALEHVTLQTPGYQRTLVADLSATVQPGEGLVIVGQSGSGKSSILRAIAGLWNAGTGRIVRPSPTEMLFLPQRPYMILGSLRSQILYPNTNHEVSDAQLYKVLEQVNLTELPDRVGGLDVELDWDDVLSLGEQQRLAFARLLLTQPHYAVLDEATSALDLRNEAYLYQQLKESATTFISVGHRSSLLQYHQHVLELDGHGGWQLLPREEYTPGATAFA
ncbi:MAG: ABC transporter ATP-binding protein/permease [Leptolyngbyaceae bacterium]|nr:ABC transporter ATP-binding protein/permease [Leptolyngbyaceae bacterium]